LTEKCIALSNDLDKVINDANLEIARLQEKVAELVISEKDLKKKNHELAENWREKGRKLAQTQVRISFLLVGRSHLELTIHCM